MSDQLVRSLFEGRLKTWAAARVPALPIAWENVSFTPPANNGTYLRSYLLRGDTTSRDLGGDNRNRVGVYQIDIVVAPGTGPGVAEGIAGELASLFPMDLLLSSGAFSVLQTSPLRVRTGLPSGDSFKVPTDFQYRADTYPA